MPIIPYTLWLLIELLIEMPPFTLANVQQVLPSNFILDDSNEWFTSYLGEKVKLSDGTIIDQIDIRINREKQFSEMLYSPPTRS